MYNKVVCNNNNNEDSQEMQEIAIKLSTDSLEKSLYYRDEGNMNIVVSLFAQEHDERRVIRFKKIPSDSTANTSSHHDIRNELMSFIKFEELLQKYFENSDHFTVIPKIVYLDIDDLHALNIYLLRDRPVIRRNKIIGHKFGLLYRDVAFLPKDIYSVRPINGEFKDSPTICIEIKAKQGYAMDDDDDDDDKNFGVKKCRYCYFQYLKLKNARINNVSNYCPIDLFSGKADRINRAILGLLENPQNNLKMFQDGKMIYNEYTCNKNALRRVMTSLFPDTPTFEKQEILFINLIRKILTKDFTICDSIADICMNCTNNDQNIHLRSCDYKFPQLSKNCILSSILNAQLLVKHNFSKMEVLDGLKEPINFDNGYENEETLQDYKIGSTALDCSIMITLRRINRNYDVISENLINRNHFVTIESSKECLQNFIVNATIVDLDEKKDSMAHFRKYKKQYQESKEAYYDFMGCKKINFID